jgi:hypothetical protein
MSLPLSLILSLPVRRIGTSDRGQLRLPLVAVREQLLLVVQQLLPRLGGVLGVGALDNGVHGARLLAEAAVDALGHVDVVAGRAAGAVGALLGLDRDGLGRADGFAQLAGDATLLAGRVAAQGVLAAEAWRDGALFEWVEDCVAGDPMLVGVVNADAWLKVSPGVCSRNVRWSEELLQHDVHAAEHLSQEEVVSGMVEDAVLLLVEAQGPRRAEVCRRCADAAGTGS